MTEEEQFVDQALAKDPLIIVLKPSKKKKQFTNAASYEKFLAAEVEFWNPLMSQTFRPRNPFAARLSDAQIALRNVRSVRPSTDAYRVEQLVSSCQHLQEVPIFSETTEGRFVGELLSASTERALGALAFLIPSTQGIASSNMTPETLRGFVDAYYRFAANPERRSKSVQDDFEKRQASLDTGYSELQDRFVIMNAELREKSAALRTEFDTQSSDLNSYRDQWKDQIETLHQGAQKRILELENLYSEKLRLQGPAEYWKGLTDRYRTSGIVWSIISGVLVVAGSVAGIWGLDFFQKALQAGQTVTQGTTTTDWSHILPVTIVFGVLISVWVFVVRTTIRLALSGFHLVRDAVEREQLSHYYLALIAENKEIEKEAQTIILQSLFSRAETGLLKGESGPTMPGSLAEILKNLRG